MTTAAAAREDGLWDVTEAAAFLGCSVLTLRSWCSRKRIPFVRLNGRLVRFREADLRSWVEGQLVPVQASERSTQ